jgi:hypothetical protein
MLRLRFMSEDMVFALIIGTLITVDFVLVWFVFAK